MRVYTEDEIAALNDLHAAFQAIGTELGHILQSGAARAFAFVVVTESRTIIHNAAALDAQYQGTLAYALERALSHIAPDDEDDSDPDPVDLDGTVEGWTAN